MFKFNRAAALTLLSVSLLSATATFAQTAEPSAPAEANEDAKAIVLKAMQGLLTDSYHYASESEVAITLTGSDQKGQSTLTLTSAEGDAAPNGDSHMTLTVHVGESEAAAQSGPHGSFERIVVGGVTYINVDDALKDILPQMEVDEGWYKLDDLLSKIYSLAIQTGLKNLGQSSLPSKLVFADDLIKDAVEAAPETVDGVEARVFDLTLNGSAIAVSQSAGTTLEKLKDLFDNRRLYAASIFDFTARVWINADGKVIKLHADSHTLLPYLTVSSEAGLSGLPNYDVDQKTSNEVTLTHYGQAVEIKAPTTIE